MARLINLPTLLFRGISEAEDKLFVWSPSEKGEIDVFDAYIGLPGTTNMTLDYEGLPVF